MKGRFSEMRDRVKVAFKGIVAFVMSLVILYALLVMMTFLVKLFQG